MNQYELMAATIERAYEDVSKGRIVARVWEAKVTPACVRFHFTVGGGVREREVTGVAAEMAYNLGLPSVRIYRQGGQFYLEAPRGDEKRAVVLTDLLRQVKYVPPFTALLGMQTDAAPLLLRLDSPDVPHALLAGTTGSGKTALLRTLLITLALYNTPGQLQLALIDPKGRGLAPLAPLPHIWRRYGIIQDPAGAENLLDQLVAEMERRDRCAVDSGHPRALPRIVVAIDELADLLDVNRALANPIQRLTQRGREAGLHVVVATQRPTAALVGSMLKANLPVRLVGKVVSPEEAKIATGLKETGAERLQGRGDFLLVAQSHLLRFQAALALPRDIAGLVTLAATRSVAGHARRRRAWADLPIELPPALPRPAPAPLPPGLGQGYLGETPRDGAGSANALLPAVSAFAGMGNEDGMGNGSGAEQNGAHSTSVDTNAGELALDVSPISHPPSSTPIDPPVAQATAAAARTWQQFTRNRRRPAPLGEGSRLRARYSVAQRLAALVEAEGNRTLACQALYGYSDTTTLRLMAEAVAEAEAAAADAGKPAPETTAPAGPPQNEDDSEGVNS